MNFLKSRPKNFHRNFQKWLFLFFTQCLFNIWGVSILVALLCCIHYIEYFSLVVYHIFGEVFLFFNWRFVDISDREGFIVFSCYENSWEQMIEKCYLQGKIDIVIGNLSMNISQFFMPYKLLSHGNSF